MVGGVINIRVRRGGGREGAEGGPMEPERK